MRKKVVCVEFLKVKLFWLFESLLFNLVFWYFVRKGFLIKEKELMGILYVDLCGFIVWVESLINTSVGYFERNNGDVV